MLRRMEEWWIGWGFGGLFVVLAVTILAARGRRRGRVDRGLVGRGPGASRAKGFGQQCDAGEPGCGNDAASAAGGEGGGRRYVAGLHHERGAVDTGSRVPAARGRLRLVRGGERQMAGAHLRGRGDSVFPVEHGQVRAYRRGAGRGTEDRRREGPEERP